MSNVIPLFPSAAQEISLFQPTTFEEAQQAIHQLKRGQLIMVNVSELTPPIAQRMLDFLSGSISILAGQSVEVGNGVFLFSLLEIEVSDFHTPRTA